MPILPRQLAARELGISESTVRRWCEQKGAPVARRGHRGKHGAALFDVDAIRVWREQRGRLLGNCNTSPQDLMQLFADILWTQFCAATGPHKRKLAAEFAVVGYRFIFALEDRGVTVPVPEPLQKLRLIAHEMSD